MYRISFFLLCILSFINLKAQVATIPFDLDDDGMVFLKVNINNSNSKPVNFVFDTGATSDVLDTSTAKDLGLTPNYHQDIAGAGGTKRYDIILSQKLILNNLVEIDNTNLVLADLTKLNERSERAFNGIIGYSLLKKYVTEINYETQNIKLFKNLNEVNTEGYTKIPFKFNKGIPIPQFDITITLKTGESFKGTILFDSGAGLTLLINTPFNEKNELHKKVDKSLVETSENLHSTSRSERIAIKSIAIDDFILDELVISLAYDKEGVSSFEGYLGILGSEIISRFNLVIDYSSFSLFLKPNATYNRPFEFPLSGISLKKVGNDILIHNVATSSEAYKKGIRAGDKLIRINKVSSNDLSDYRALLKKENSHVNITIINAKGQTQTLTIHLTRLL